MPSGMEIFTHSGPSHLTTVDWKNPHHRRTVAASLVEGAYKIERDRQQNLQGHEALAPPWWEFFHFQVSHVLVDDVDHSIFGVIYESKFPTSYFKHSELKAPRYVMAFRGTLTQPDTRSRDLRLDFRCISNRLHESSRFQLAMQSIQNMVSLAGAENVWLAGHSLGSAIALQAGKSMTKMGFALETYLFNPPFISAPTERIKEERVKHGIHMASSVVKAGLSHVVKSRNNRNTTKEEDPFVVLASWSPYLFLNPADHICSGYIGYFEHRKKMEEIGAGKIERLALKNSIESIFSGALGKESEPFNFLPSAIVTINQTPAPDFRRAHGVEQWWNPNFHYRSMVFHFSN
ncbi:GDSL esterase/lipase At4g10955 [Ziziphus jujuba]|uniref:GDSL esterase/lipase At4g10955 n=2 Tax=Ziziphus jujuba TaxID=326968 RepID=A0A6P3ZJ29_ZIZJJ|nr:GDSL esterase/lipase At4g10955 [Ziziphus jujuba]XP_060676077.1 GDSL esterase/lipase At4g10955 [Ziziphus jujuba]XP_060676078.1 GDSL esterase/lipase At4g10955 [Ziziphus jujuba]